MVDEIGNEFQIRRKMVFLQTMALAFLLLLHFDVVTQVAHVLLAILVEVVVILVS